MPSPFPGMDPCIEASRIWSDFHQDLAGEIRTALNRRIRPRYLARITPYVTYEEVEIETIPGARPDVGVERTARNLAAGTGATATIPRAPARSSIPLELPLRLANVEVFVVETGQIVTAIEILSPVNKRPRHDAFADYRRKRRGLFRSAVHLIEIDLLRGGTRPELGRPVPPAPCYVVLSQSELRPEVDVWPILLQDALPALPVPLLAPDSDAELDLGAAVASVYERADTTIS